MLIVFKVFVNRNDEFNYLDSAYRSGRSEFIVIYGRRRIGKTELLREFIKDKNAVYFLADERSDQDNLSDFRTLVGRGIGNEILSASNLDWGDTLKEVSKNEKRLIIVIDEYPYLISGNKSIPSIFQKAWDLYLNDSNVMLILCGSSISMMEQHVLGSKSPLYGRRSGQIRVEPLKFKHTASFFPELMTEDLVKIYGITDGIPYYLNEARYRIKKISDLESIYSVEGLLIEEAEILLKCEFRGPAKYFSILKALAFGNTKFGDIVNATGLSSSIVSQYLSNLIILNIVKAQYPVTDMNQRSRNARYYITDNYFTFWFRFVYPNKSLIYNNLLIPDFRSDFNRYLGHVFEKISAEFLWEVRPFGFTQMGRWWHKDVEIDLVAFNEKTKEMMFVECKWSSLSMGDCLRVLNKLKEKSMAIKWNPGDRNEYFGIIAKRIEGKDALREKGFLVFDLDDFIFK